MRNEIKLTDEQIETIFDKLGAGICADELVFTRETIEDFEQARKSYALPGIPQRSVNNVGYPVLAVDGIQAAKGQQRFDLLVVDFGTVRAVSR